MLIICRQIWTSRVMFIMVFHHTARAQHQDGGCSIHHCIRCRGHTCTVCLPGLYGPSCENTCPANCRDVRTCISGYCSTKGCKDGWYGPKCRESCTEGCAVCHVKTGSCLIDPTPDCHVGCYCILGYCSRCRNGYKGDRCETREAGEYSTSASVDKLTAGLIGVSLVIGIAGLSICITCYVRVRYWKWKSSYVRSHRLSLEVNNQSNDSRDGETADLHSLVRFNGSRAPPSLGTSCHMTALPPSYDSIFSVGCGEPGIELPPTYERTSEL